MIHRFADGNKSVQVKKHGIRSLLPLYRPSQSPLRKFAFGNTCRLTARLDRVPDHRERDPIPRPQFHPPQRGERFEKRISAIPHHNTTHPSSPVARRISTNFGRGTFPARDAWATKILRWHPHCATPRNPRMICPCSGSAAFKTGPSHGRPRLSCLARPPPWTAISSPHP